jgi:hypothetical protein
VSERSVGGRGYQPERTKVSVEDGAVRAPASTPTPSCRRRGPAAAGVLVHGEPAPSGVLVHGEHAPAGVLVHWEFVQRSGDYTCGVVELVLLEGRVRHAG